FPHTDTAPTQIYTLSLHDALPISCGRPEERNSQEALRPHPGQSTTSWDDAPKRGEDRRNWRCLLRVPGQGGTSPGAPESAVCVRSEEHTSELQSLRHLVCRLLLEK